jgi:hypothetical protein
MVTLGMGYIIALLTFMEFEWYIDAFIGFYWHTRGLMLLGDILVILMVFIIGILMVDVDVMG